VDSRTAGHKLDIFNNLSKTMGVTVVIVTHDLQMSKRVDRVVAIRDGRTSSEIIRKRSYAEELAELKNGGFSGDGDDTHEEFSVLDRSGRLQLPGDYVSSMGLAGRNRIKVQLEGNRIVLSAPEEKVK